MKRRKVRGKLVRQATVTRQGRRLKPARLNKAAREWARRHVSSR